MLFNSIEFLFIFLPIVFISYYLICKTKFIKYANLLLLTASLYFYSYYKVEYLPIIFASIVFNFVIGFYIQKSIANNIKKTLLILTVAGNLAILCYYKYFNFIIDTFNSLALTNFNTMKIMLPLGISFFTFQQISYIYDIYKGEAKQTNIIDYSLFVSFFPQLISGPICTFKELIPQFQDEKRKLINQENISKGLFLLAAGLFKKVIIADNFTDFINNYMYLNAQTDFYTSWLYAFSIAFQLYFDFSGYCDMASGIALFFNIKLPINFNSPYKSIDISEYWRKWHITMGRFLKYNVYIPMGGSRKGTLKTYYNLLFVFILVGIWHGANWACILYGVLNGILVCINKFWKQTGIQINKHLSVLITFITMVFMAPLILLKYAGQYFILAKSMLGINTSFLPLQIHNFNFIFSDGDYRLNCILFISCFIIIFCFKNTNQLADNLKANKIYLTATLLMLIISVLSINKVSEFIYFQF